ncbi:hypothetical protein B9Z51_08615 [Limnohabitans sp. T6-5]|uniref:phage tail tip fiber protein n=1 Tax=Limnohabitans sp. T6-5 TaxID=1100724 RepID=UPI000D38B9A9|nr:DUF1983 domain-containing protein [Limnohabitans sp. T6-5]PUE08986.1 hypothetical protein B9Z51_08615 [Limnohabitans sp. T6-5]
MTDRPELPSPNAPNYAQRVRETLMTYLGVQGDPLNRGITLRDLIENGFATLSAGWRPGGSGVPSLKPGSAVVSSEVDLTPPPTPEGFTLSAAISHVFIECSSPVYTQGHGHLRTRVYGVTHTAGTALPTFSNAIELGQFGGQVWAMPSNPATTWRLWIKWESVDGVLSAAPAGGTNGLAATTGQDVQLLLDALEGKIKEGQLWSALSERIDLIDGPASLIGSVAARLLAEATARGTAITNERTARTTADTALALDITTLTATVNNNQTSTAAAIQQEAQARATADVAEATARDTLAARVTTTEQGVASNAAAITTASAAITDEQTVRAQKDAALAQSISNLQAIVETNKGDTNTNIAAQIQEEAYARATADLAEATARNMLAARVTTNERDIGSNTSSITQLTGALQEERSARASKDEAIVQSVTRLQATVNEKSVALQQESEVRATADGKLFAQYTVKIDNNGYVTGYGLASTLANGIPKSEFAIRADRFYIASPTGPGITPVTPFIVQTTPVKINGVDVPVGVYMSDAFIRNGTITNAKIANLAVDDAKIASLSVSKLTAGSISVGTNIRSSNNVPGTSGWVIRGNGDAEFSNVTMRGSIYSSYGEIGGNVIGNDYISSPQYYEGGLIGWALKKNGDVIFNNASVRGSISSGDFKSYSWPLNSYVQGFYLGPEGFLIGDKVRNRYFQITSSGDVYAPSFRIVGGSAYFSGNLSANIISADNIISKSATSFEQVSAYPMDGHIDYMRFYMDHAGVVTLVGLCHYYYNSSGGDYYFKFSLDLDPLITFESGSYWDSGGPTNSFGLYSTYLSQGLHTIYVSAHHSGAGSYHETKFLILRSYR